MAGRFYVVPFEAHDKLSELGPSARDVYYSLLRYHFIDEDWDTETEWVRGRIRTSKADIWRLAEVAKGHFFRTTWPSLVGAGLVMDNEDGTISIEKLKKKIDEGISPAQIRELAKKIKHLEAVINDLAQTGGSGRKPDGSLGENHPESGERPHEASQETDQSGERPPRARESFLSPRFKDLSLCTISSFYTGIGQTKFSEKKRERGLKIYQKLIDEGFTPEQIQFTVDWTVKNATEELYDFSIIEHTIGQAMAEMERQEKKQEQREQKEREAAEKEREEGEEEKERRRVLEHKKSLGPEERKALRREAEKEIKESGQFDEEFIDDFIIEIRENMILRRRLSENNIED